SRGGQPGRGGGALEGVAGRRGIDGGRPGVTGAARVAGRRDRSRDRGRGGGARVAGVGGRGLGRGGARVPGGGRGVDGAGDVAAVATVGLGVGDGVAANHVADADGGVVGEDVDVGSAGGL